MIKIKNLTIDEFQKKMKTKKIICFCAGKKFREFYNKYQINSALLYVVDNYVQDTVIKIDDQDIPVVPVSRMGEEIKDCILLITSVIHVNEIIEQLDTISLCSDLTFYIPDLFTTTDEHINFNINRPQKIPKTIHYCWFGRGKMPERFCKNIETWKKNCPDYKIIRWDESNYDISKNRYMEQAYKAQKWGFVPDYARLDIINENGGIYLDTDVEILKPWDELLQFELFCGFEASGYVAFGLGFGACKSNKIVKEMLDVYEKLDFFLPDGNQNLVPSPKYQTDVLEKYGLKKNGKTQITNEYIALSPEYLSPISPYGIGKPTEYSFSIHQYAATWFDGNQQEEKEKLIENYKYIIERMKNN